MDVTPEAARRTTTIADVVAGVPELSTLAAALAAPAVAENKNYNLSQQLADPKTNFTLFAPSNEAWEALFAVERLPGLEALSNFSDLLPVVLLHVANGSYLPNSLDDEWRVEIPTLSPSLFSNISGKNVARFVSYTGARRHWSTVAVNALLLSNYVYDDDADAGISPGAYALRSFSVANGVVYVIDGVLAPLADLAGTLASDDDLSFFSEAIDAAGLAGELGAGSCPDPATAACNVTGMTAFASTDEAWDEYAERRGATRADLLKLPEVRVYPPQLTLCVHHILP